MKKLVGFAIMTALLFVALPVMAGTNSHLMLSMPMGVEVEAGGGSSAVSGALMLQADSNLFPDQFAPIDDIGLHLEIGMPVDAARMPRIGLGPVFKFSQLMVQVAAVQQLYLKETNAMMGVSITPIIVFDKCLGLSYRATVGAIVPKGEAYVSHLVGLAGYFPENMFR